jgi:ABC-2 type transport system permease protein
MQLRKPAIWITSAIPFGLFAVLAVMGTQNLERLTQDTNPKTWMVESLGWFTPLLAMVFGIVLADRLVRDRKLGVAPLLDVTPTNRSARLIGKYFGACVATAVPPALIYLIVGLAFAIWRDRPAALLWGAATFALVVLPLLLLTGALAFLGPLEGAALNVLRPQPTTGTALLSLALILGLAAAILAAARALSFRTSE